ncbi:unnamed protein product [Arabidopsis halleri]
MQNGGQDKSNHTAGLQSKADVEFEMFRRNYVAEMWRDVCATEMTLGGLQGVTPPSNPGQKIARALDFGPREEEREAIDDEGLRLTLAGKGMGTHKPTILTLSSTDSSFGTPSTESTSISFSTEDLMDDSIDINSPTGVIDGPTSEEYHTDPDGPLCISPVVPTHMTNWRGVVEANKKAALEKGSGSNDVVHRGGSEIVVRETPVPTVLYDGMHLHTLMIREKKCAWGILVRGGYTQQN